MFTNFRAALDRKNGARRARRELARDIAAYSSPADRLDFEAILDRYPEVDTAFMRSILSNAA